VKNLHIWLLVALVIAGGAFMACKSDKKKTTEPTATASADTTMEPSDTPSASDGGNGDAPSLDDLVSNVGSKTVKATYTFSGTGATGEETFTLYSRPPDSRVDLTSGGSTSIFISAGGTDYICDDGSQTCSVSPIPLGSTLPFLALVTDPQALSGAVGSDLDHSTETIAGQDADCYSASAAGATSEVCFNDDGILVRLHASVGGSDFTMEATSASSTVSDADLEPPYPVE